MKINKLNQSFIEFQSEAIERNSSVAGCIENHGVFIEFPLEAIERNSSVAGCIETRWRFL